MGFGGTTEKLQKVASMAEDVYAKLNELRDQIQAMRETVDRVDRRTAENRALLEAIATDQDVDVDAVLTETAIEEAENVGSTTDDAAGDDGSDAATDGSTTTTDAADGSTDAADGTDDDGAGATDR
jgi:nitrogen fixation/metabolism regulation signal transduction histidine kinase